VCRSCTGAVQELCRSCRVKRGCDLLILLSLDSVHIHSFDYGFHRFRSDSGSLGKAPSNQALPAPPLGTSPGLGVPERRHCSAAKPASLPVYPLRKPAIAPNSKANTRSLWELACQRWRCVSHRNFGCAGPIASRLTPTVNRSDYKICVRPQIPCGSGLAHDWAGTSKKDLTRYPFPR